MSKLFKSTFTFIAIFIVTTIGISGKIFYDKIDALSKKLLLATSKNIRLIEANSLLKSKNIKLIKTNKTLKTKNTKLIKTNKSLSNKNTKLSKSNKFFVKKQLQNKKRIKAYKNRVITVKKSALKKIIPSAGSKSIPFVGTAITVAFITSDIKELCDDMTEVNKLESDLFGYNNSSDIENYCKNMLLIDIEKRYDSTTAIIKNKYNYLSNSIKKEAQYTIDFWKYKFNSLLP